MLPRKRSRSLQRLSTWILLSWVSGPSSNLNTQGSTDNPPARTMRHLGAMGYIEETAADEYKPTNFSKALAIPIIGDGYPCM